MTPAHRRAPASPGRLALVLAGCAALGVAVAYLLQPSAPRPVAGAPGDVLPRVEPLPDYTPPPAPPRASTPPRKPSAPAPAASTPAPKPKPKPVRKRTAPPPAAPKPTPSPTTSAAKPEQPAKTTVKPQVKPPAAPKKAPVPDAPAKPRTFTAPAPPPADADGLMPDERAVKLINLAREAHYLPSLTYDSGSLNERAVSDAWHLSKGRRSFAFGGVRTRGAATADEAVRDLLLSHTTRPELLSSLHTRIGVGYVADGGYWSFHFS